MIFKLKVNEEEVIKNYTMCNVASSIPGCNMECVKEEVVVLAYGGSKYGDLINSVLKILFTLLRICGLLPICIFPRHMIGMLYLI